MLRRAQKKDKRLGTKLRETLNNYTRMNRYDMPTQQDGVACYLNPSNQIQARTQLSNTMTSIKRAKYCAISVTTAKTYTDVTTKTRTILLKAVTRFGILVGFANHGRYE